MFVGAEALDRGVLREHGECQGIAGVVGIEAAVDLVGMADEMREPERVWSGPCSRDAEVVRMEAEATEGIDG